MAKRLDGRETNRTILMATRTWGTEGTMGNRGGPTGAKLDQGGPRGTRGTKEDQGRARLLSQRNVIPERSNPSKIPILLLKTPCAVHVKKASLQKLPRWLTHCHLTVHLKPRFEMNNPTKIKINRS